jgi:23S rRNA (cytosine1962-C5)-methyltransferase
MARLILKPGRERSVRRCHPWIFNGAIHRVDGDPGSGDTVDVAGSDGEPLGVAMYSPVSQIAARMWSFTGGHAPDVASIRARLERALTLRRSLARDVGEFGAERLVNAESDGLPGVIIDRYADVLVCQFLSAGAERWRHVIVEEAAALTSAGSVYERSDVDVRTKEGLEPRAGLLKGVEPPQYVEIVEGPCRFLVDVRAGHKTGAYLDQRENRFGLRAYVANRDVLNCFSYTGGFSLHALSAGAAHVTNIDTSQAVLLAASRHADLNGIDAERLEQIEGDVFHVLRRFRDTRRTFDAIILDPPKFAESKAQMERAARGYKDINLLAFKLLRPSGLLFTFSCSGAIQPELFQKIVADAALDAHVDARMLCRLAQAPDHPVLLSFPEGLYLKGLICAV